MRAHLLKALAAGVLVCPHRLGMVAAADAVGKPRVARARVDGVVREQPPPQRAHLRVRRRLERRAVRAEVEERTRELGARGRARSGLVIDGEEGGGGGHHAAAARERERHCEQLG
eukprot:4236230-Prymnesium_polylepis.2